MDIRNTCYHNLLLIINHLSKNQRKLLLGTKKAQLLPSFVLLGKTTFNKTCTTYYNVHTQLTANNHLAAKPQSYPKHQGCIFGHILRNRSYQSSMQKWNWYGVHKFINFRLSCVVILNLIILLGMDCNLINKRHGSRTLLQTIWL